MNTRFLMGLSGVAVAVLTGCQGAGASKTDSSQAAAASAPADDGAVRKTIASLDSQFVAAFNKGDAATAASFYSEDAVSRPPNQEPETGRAAIQQGYEGLFKSVGKVSDFAIEPKDLDVFGDRAVEIGAYTFHFTPPGAKAAMKDHGSFLNYWRKQLDGSWKITRDIIVSSEPMPGQGPPPPASKK